MRDRWQIGKQSHYVTVHSRQLSLIVHRSVGEWYEYQRCSSHISVVYLCKLVFGHGLRKQGSAPSNRPCRSCGSWELHVFYDLMNFRCLLCDTVACCILFRDGCSAQHLILSANGSTSTNRACLNILRYYQTPGLKHSRNIHLWTF